MSSAFSMVVAGLGRRRRRWARPLRWIGTAALLVAGVVVFVPATDDSNPTCDISFAAALPIWLFALTWPVWRAPDRELPEGLRWRRRHRRACWRASLLTLFGSCLALLSCAYWEYRRDQDTAYRHYDHLDHLAALSGTTALWLLLLSPVPGLLDAPLWRLWPAPLRRAAALGRIAEELNRPDRFRLKPAGAVPPPGFDPDRGWLGRPMPVFERHPEPGRGAPLSIGPGADILVKGPFAQPSLSWDGALVTFTDVHQPGIGVPVERVAELVDVRESFESGSYSLLMLLDPTGRSLVSMPDRGFRRDELASLAVAAGIPFACYDLGRSEGRRPLSRRLFPEAPEAAGYRP